MSTQLEIYLIGYLFTFGFLYGGLLMPNKTWSTTSRNLGLLADIPLIIVTRPFMKFITSIVVLLIISTVWPGVLGYLFKTNKIGN